MGVGVGATVGVDEVVVPYISPISPLYLPKHLLHLLHLIRHPVAVQVERAWLGLGLGLGLELGLGWG